MNEEFTVAEDLLDKAGLLDMKPVPMDALIEFLAKDGLELHYWPIYRIRVAWQDVERLGKCKLLGVFSCDALYLNRAEARARNATIREWGLAKRCIVPLSDFRGWPDGELADDLRWYIPHVFTMEEAESLRQCGE